jgi:hypothetical protein
MNASAAMVLLFWDIGSAILERQRREGWGTKVIDRFSADLRREFPDIQGLSPRNLKYMRAFAAAWPDRQIVQQVAAQIPWFRVGQMNLYLSAADDLMRHPDDKPTIGLLLCKGKDRLVVEYALRDVKKPIGVAGWETRLVETLPEELKGSLPTVKELEAELQLVEKREKENGYGR